MKIKFFILSLLLILMVFTVTFSSININNRLVQINQSNLSDSISMISKDSIINYLKLLDVIKDSMYVGNLDLFNIEKNIDNIDYVKDSNVFIGINSSLEIEINERIPVIELKNLNVYLDRDGTIVPKSKINKPETIKFFGNIDSTNYRKISNLGSLIINDEFLNHHIKYIFSNSKKIFIKSKNHDYNIQLGSLEMFKTKLLNYKFFYVTKFDKDIISRIEKINLKFENQVIVEKK